MIKQGRSFSGRERNCCFLNMGNRRFATVSAVSGLDFPDDGRAIAVVDWDHDGDLDLWISNRNAPRLRLMRNESTAPNHWLDLRLIGNGKTTNRDGIGARVEVALTKPMVGHSVATLRAGEGFLAQSSKWLHFGLGAATTVGAVTVTWPGGQTEVFTGMDVDRRYALAQGSGRPRPIRVESRSLVLTPSTPKLPTPSSEARIPLAVRLPLPQETYLRFDGTRQRLARRKDRALLVNLWSPSCRPCVAELKEMVRAERQLRDAGVDVLALAVDALDARQAKTAAAEDLLAGLKFPFHAGRAEVRLVEDFQRLHDDLILMRKPMPIPCSFLIDRRGRLAVIYEGPVDVGQLVEDAGLDPQGYQQRWELAACLPGRALNVPHVVETALKAETRTRYRVAISLQDDGRIGDAAAGFEALLGADPDCAEAHRQLAAALLESGHPDQAKQHCQQALARTPDDARVHNTLAIVLAGEGQLEAAQSHYERAIELAPNFAEAHNNLGTLLAGAGKLSEAQQAFERAIALDAKFAEAYNNLGSVFAARNDLAHAAMNYAQAVQINPEYAEAFNNLGTMNARRGKFVRAQRCYERAIAIDPGYRQARDNLRRLQKLRAAAQPSS